MKPEEQGPAPTAVAPTSKPGAPTNAFGRPPAPSFLYRTELWRLGPRFVRAMPEWFCRLLFVAAADSYWLCHGGKRRIIVDNLLPVVGNDPVEAERSGKRLMRQFALKLADIWRVEAGASMDDWLVEWGGWEHYQKAHARGNGVLMLAPHLGNWELGGPLLSKKGADLVVVTQAEPDPGLAETMRTSRERWKVRTVVVGQDAFAFIDVIRHLQAGATVALLIDRPVPASAVTVEMFGRPFQASIAPAELARASGCAVMGTYIPKLSNKGYAAHIMPEYQYDRRSLGSREARRQMTQEITQSFEDVIRKHRDQWYHFVPLWQNDKPTPMQSPSRSPSPSSQPSSSQHASS